MEFQSLPQTQAKLINEIKETMFSSLDINPYSLVFPCAYDTAWLAMIPHPNQPSKPMFEGCLSWVLNNQTEHGFWGNCDDQSGMPTLECLTATLACVVALRKWNVGSSMISKGLEFIHSSNAKRLLKEMKKEDFIPQWFAIVFPGMVELAEEVLKIQILKDQSVVVSDIFYHRQLIFQKELHNKETYLLSYLEVLPSSYFNEELIIKKLCEKGSLFQSPSATAQAFMATENSKCLHYLQTLVHKFSNNNNNNIIGVPTTYPMDKDLIKLCIINYVERLGLAEHFTIEIEQLLQQVYKNYVKCDGEFYYEKSYHSLATLELHLLKESLAFRLLRMHGYKVFPSNIYWILKNEDIKNHIESNYECFSVTMLNLYRATDLAFHGEFELDELRIFSRKLLQKSILVGARHTNPFNKLIENELSLPWMARLDHLEHRLFIEQTNEAQSSLWMGKTSFQRLSRFHNDKLVRLATLNYEFKQSIYKTELEQLTRWCKYWGLNEMGFGREKSTYCYFAVASACCSLPYDSPIRLMVAKGAIIITITDDFFDMKESLITELKTFTKAFQRWDGKELSGVSKKIFDALDNLVSEMATMYLEQQENSNHDITNWLRKIWYETICSWLTESEWSKNGIVPTMDEYLKVGMTSIATHTLLLPASCFVINSTLPVYSQLRPIQCESVTKLVMTICRLLNDLQSYEKEKEEGKPNSITVYMKNNSEVEMEEAVKYVKEILNKKKKELLEHVMIDGFTNLSKECRHLHLSCLKVFQMFFNSSNRYDSDTEMLEDISKAIYVPLKSIDHEGLEKNLLRPPKSPMIDLTRVKSTTTKCSMNMNKFSQPTKCFVIMNELSLHQHKKVGNWKISTPIMPSQLNFCFI
ncbi:(E,E)-geranyllinalool synthase isoform X1 [Cannabis sativa]|uniref:(E,E)-geranyllinalool synthase isoform X1 n=1 Tax=Cannabis sativa TaxID=3483 RepID=UPI0029CA14E2|nr:(E,E)-geranyllinalool synthase isoform X1 [Cannabis sativa]